MVPFGQNRALHRMIAGMLLMMGASAHQPAMVFDWWLENVLVFAMCAFWR
jgi:hypothetical protein